MSSLPSTDGLERAQVAPTFASKLRTDSNNFDLIRLCAALLVILAHSYSLSGSGSDAVTRAVGLYSGTLAVAIFFVISGFLVFRSLELHDTGVYLRARLLRIIPGLALITVIEAYVIGPLFYDGDSLPTYFREVATSHLHNILVFGENPFVPGVFSKLRYPYVNGSLWSLPLETLFYLLLPIIGMMAGRRRWVWFALYLASLVAEPIAISMGIQSGNADPEVFRTVHLYSICEFVPYFLGGVTCWLYRDTIRWSGGFAAVLFLTCFAAHDTMALHTIMKIALPYLVLFVGMYSGWGNKLKKRVGDLSYGVYLAGYPAINSVIALGESRPVRICLIACLASLVYAVFSWWVVERNALRLKG